LQGSYFNTDGTQLLVYGFDANHVWGQNTPLTTYGEGPINDGGGLYNGVYTNWAGIFNSSSQFEEKLTGQIYIGSNTTPPLGTIGDELPPVIPPVDPPPTDGGGATPEPASWWLVAAALPFIAFSKLRLRHANARQ
jgi:hypothetical protein